MTGPSPLDLLLSEDGALNVDRPLPAHELFVPEFVTLDARSERIRYFPDPAGARIAFDEGLPAAPAAAAKARLRIVQPRAGLLTDFVQLADAPPERILKYAKRWGVLELCAAHRFPIRTRDGHDGVRWCPPLYDPEIALPYRHEHVDDWRRYAAMFRSLLLRAAELQGRPAADPRGTFAHTIKFTCWLGDVGPDFVWRKGRMAFELASRSGLFGALAVQAAFFAAATQGGLAICSACGKPYVPSRPPVPGRRTYCADCRRAGVPLRDAQRDLRQRKRAKRSRAHRAKGGTHGTSRSR